MPPVDPEELRKRKAARERAFRSIQGTGPATTIIPATAPAVQAAAPEAAPSAATTLPTSSVPASSYPNLLSAITKLKNEVSAKVRQESIDVLSEEEIQREIDRQLQEILPAPIYGGDFGLKRPQAPSVPMIAPPMMSTPRNLPGPGGIVQAVGDIVGAQTRAPERAARGASVFNDVKFENEIAKLPPSSQMLERGAYQGLKKVFQKIKLDNPAISDQDAINRAADEADAANKALSGDFVGGIVQTAGLPPAAPPSNTGNPALDKQIDTLNQPGLLETPKVTSGRRMFMPTELQQLYLNEYNAASKKSRRLQAEDELKAQTVQRLPGAAGIAAAAIPGATAIGTARKMTPAEIKEDLDKREAAGEFDPPIEFQPEKMKEFLEDPEKFATGGIIFDKQYPSGLVIESPTNQLLRIVAAPFSAISGIAGGLAKKLPGVIDVDQPDMGRDVKYRGEGIGDNIIANIQDIGGYQKEADDIAKNNTFLLQHPFWATVFRMGAVALDFSGGGDIALLKGAGGLGRGARAAKIAGEAAGVSKLPLAKSVAMASARQGVASYLEEIPFFSRYAKGIEPGDVRLVYGTHVAESLVRNGEMKKFESEIDSLRAGQSEEAQIERQKSVEDIAKEVVSIDQKIEDNRKLKVQRSDEKKKLSVLINNTEKRISVAKNNLDDISRTGKVGDKKIVDKDFLEEIRQKRSAEIKNTEKIVDDLNRELTNKSNDIINLDDEIEALQQQKIDIAKGRRGSIRSTISGRELSKIADVLPVAIKSGSPILQEEIRAIRDRARGRKVKVSDLLASLTFDSYDELKEMLINSRALEIGVTKVDDALSAAGLKGAKLFAVTPATLATKRAADDIEKAYKGTPLFKDVMDPISKAGPSGKLNRRRFLQDGKLIDTVELDQEQFRIVNDAIDDAANRLDPVVADRIRQSTESRVEDVTRFYVGVNDLRKVSYATADVIGQALGKGINRRMISQEIGGAKVTRQARGPAGLSITAAGAENINVARRMAELTSDYPIAANRLKSRMIDTLTPIEKFVDPETKTAIQNAKNRLSSLAKEMRSEIEAVKTNRDVATRFFAIDELEGLTDNEIIIALGSEGTLKRRQFAEHLLDSMIFSTDRNPLYNAFMPNYNWGKGILKNSEEYDKLLTDIQDLNPKDLLYNLNDIFDKMKGIVDREVNLEIKAAGGQIVAVPKSLQQDVLISAYARKKAQDIVRETTAEAMSKFGIDVSDELQTVSNLAKQGDVNAFREYINTAYRGAADQMRNPAAISDLITQATFDQGVAKNFVEMISPQSSPAMKRFLTQEINSSVRNYNQTGRLEGILGDMVSLSEKYASYDMQDIIPVIDLLIKDKIPPDRFVSPELVMKIKQELGSVTDFNNFLSETARLSELASKGSVSAIGASKLINDMLYYYNKGYYSMMLTMAPRFHGMNNFGAPLAIAYTTGRWPILKNPIDNYKNAWMTAILGKSPENINRNIVAVTDRFGNAYTRGDLYDLAIKSGLFKSQVRASVPSDIQSDIKSMLRPTMLDKAEKISFVGLLGSELANFTDDVHRMTTVIDALKSGETIESALDVGRRSLFDYGTITGAERQIAGRFFIFYNYWRQSVVQFMKNMIKDPLKMIKFMQITPIASRVMIGDQNARDLAFYYPKNWGTSSIMLSLQPGERYAEGKSVRFASEMPYSDGLHMMAQALISPMSLLTGPENADLEKTTDFQNSIIAQRLGPGASLGINLATGKWYADVEIKNNRLPIEHAIIYSAIGMNSIVKSYLPSYQLIPATSGERGYEFNPLSGPQAVYLDDADSVRYSKFITLIQGAGLTRAMNDWTRILSGGSLKGPYPTTWPEYLSQISGLTTTGGATMPAVLEKRVIEQQQREIEQMTKQLKERRIGK